MGITGSGKSFQWLSMAKALKPTGAIFRVIDSDAAIEFMLEEQFPELMPENGGNVYVFEAFDWKELVIAKSWARQETLKPEILKGMDKYLKHAYTTKIIDKDWLILDMADRPWEAVQEYYVEQAFGESYGDFFLSVRQQIHERGEKGKDGKEVISLDKEAMDGWKDWTVINKLYKTWMNPLTYQTKCHIFMTTKPKEVSKKEKDAEVMILYGPYKIMPTGQKHLGHAFHSLFLFYPSKIIDGERTWGMTTIKDRAGRGYYDKTPLTDFYIQYFVVNAGWDMVLPE